MSRRMMVGFIAALLTTAGTVYVILLYAGGYRRFWALSAQISPTHWIVLIGLTVLFYLMDYARYYTLFALCGEKLPLTLGLQMTCVSYFVSTLTPGSELYIPAVIFLASRRGISASHAAAVAMIKPFYLTAWVCLVGFISLFLNRDIHLPGYMARNPAACLLPFGLVALVFTWVIFFPERFFRWAPLAKVAKAISSIGRSRRPMHLAAHAAALLFILAYAAVGGVIAHSLNMPLSLGKTLAIFSNSLMVCYLAPSPAGMGITEMATSYLLDPAMTHGSMVASTLLRFLCWYSVVIPGALILAYAVMQEGLDKVFRNRSTNNQ